MKSLIISSLALMLSFSFTSCEEMEDLAPDNPNQQIDNSGGETGSNDPNDSNNNSSFPFTPAGLSSNLESQTWTIELFIEDFDNETSDFTGYVFTFNNNGTVEAQKGNTNRSGSWGSYLDDGQTEFWMSFAYSDYFDELSDDWYMRINTSEKIRFEGSNPNEDVLVFVPY